MQGQSDLLFFYYCKNSKHERRTRQAKSLVVIFMQPTVSQRLFSSKWALVFLIIIGLLIALHKTAYADITALHEIFSIYESPQNNGTTLQVRTSLGVNYVWASQNGRTTHGTLLSYGGQMQVWEIRFSMLLASQQVEIIANCRLITSATSVIQIYTIGAETANPTATINQQRVAPAISPRPPTSIDPRIITTATITNIAGVQTTTVTATANWQGITVSGDENFVRRTLNALDTIENGPEWAYTYVTTFLSYIVQCPRQYLNPRSGGRVNVRTRRFYVYTQTYTTNRTGWYASAILHEAVHVRQHEEHRAVSPNTAFNATHADRLRIEIEAVEIQVRFLDDIGATDTANMARRIIADIHRGIIWW